jgi:hypothetical protein
MTPGQPNRRTLNQGWKVRMLAGWGATRPAYEASPLPWVGLVAVGMRKIGRMSSWLVTATPPDPRPAPPSGRAPLLAPA